MEVTIQWYKNRAWAHFEFSSGKSLDRTYFKIEYAVDEAYNVVGLDDSQALSRLVMH